MFVPPLPGEHCFPAIIKTEDGRIVGDGYAHASLQEGYVEFNSAFVPSFFIGTTLSIIRMVEDAEANCFTGRVYLSSPELLRIVGVDKKLIAEIEIESLQKIDLAGRASPIVSKNSIFQFVAERLLHFPISLFELSINKVKFTSTQYFDMGEYLQISLSDPLPLRKLVVRVTDQLLFGQKKIGYRGDIISLPPDGTELLSVFLTEHVENPPPEDDPLDRH